MSSAVAVIEPGSGALQAPCIRMARALLQWHGRCLPCGANRWNRISGGCQEVWKGVTRPSAERAAAPRRCGSVLSLARLPAALRIPQHTEPSTSYSATQQQQQQPQRQGWWPGQRRQQQQSQQQQQQQSSSGGRRITIPRGEIPLDLLVTRPDPSKLRPSVLASQASVRRANRDAAWAMKREHVFAALAAGFHVALFAYNLAFWGFEGQAPDRCAERLDF